MEEFDNAIPPLGVEPGLPSNFEGSDAFQASIAPTNEPLISVTDTYAVPGVPVPSAFGSVAVDYDPSNPFDVAKQAMAKPITESDVAFETSKEKYFQPGYQQTNFDRYYNDSDNFYKLGFNPVGNNEALYNQNRSWYQDLFRAAGGIPALGLSVVQSGYRSLADMATGDFSMTDETGAREFSQIMAERGSTRGGAAGFVSNLALQSGFVAGIAADYLATEAILTGAVALSDGMALPAALAASASKTAGTIKSISALFDANTARQAYNTIKAMDVAAIGRGALNVAEATAKNIVPNTFKNVKSFITAESPVLGLANSVRGVADFVRDMKQISYATAEASMEGGGVKNDFIDKHINEYITENGVYPDQDRLNRIYEKAADAGFTTGMINAPLILLTNNITFDNLYKGRKRTLGKTASGIVEESKLSGRTLRFSEKTGQFETMGIRQSFAESVRGLKTPKTYLNFASSYFSKNLSEGLQEISQEIVSGASTDYYERLYDTPEAGGVVAYLADAYDNLKDQASAQGIEVFASGFLMGGLTGISTAVANRAYGSTKNIIGKIAQAKNPEEYRKAYAEESARFDKIAVELNDAINNGNKILALDIDNLLVQIKAGTDMVNARKSFDEKAFHDLKDIARFNSIYTALRAGKYDYFLSNLEDMKQMTGAELKEAFDLKDDVTDEEAKQVLDITIDRAGQIKDQYEQFSAFKNPYDINKYKFANTPEAIIAFVNESQNHEAFEEARKTAVFSLHGLEQAKTRMADLTKEMSSIAGVADLGYSDVTATLSIPGIDKEINLLTAEIDASKDITDPGLIEITNNKKKKLKALESLKTNLARIENINDPVEVRKTSYLKKAFTDYMKVLLDEKGTTLNPANIGEAYRIFTDYYALNYDKTNFNKLLSDLYDPNNFIKLAQRERTLIVARDKRRAEFFKKAFNKYAESSKIGVFLKALAETGFVIDLKYLKALDTNTFDELKELILNDPDIKFRDLNSNKLFGSDDPRYEDVKKFISEFVVQVTPPVAETIVTEGDSLTAEPTETNYVTIDELENLDPYFNFVLTRFYEKENKDRKNNKQAPLSYIEYSLYPAAQNVINAFKELQVLYDAQKKEGDTVDKWLTNSQANADVYNIISKYGIPVAELANLLANPDVFVMNTLPPNFKLETPAAINGLFIISGETTNKDDEVEYTYLLVDNRSNLVDVTGAYKTLPIALEARERLAKTYIKESEGFQFGNKYFYNGQTVSDSKGNTYTVVSNADSIKQAIAAGGQVVLELKNEEGRIVPKRSVQDIFPGPYQKKNPDIAYIKDVDRYNSIYPHKTQEEFGSPEGEKAAEARLKEFLLNTPIDDIKNNLSIKLTKNKVTNTRGSYLKIGDKTNANILERKEKISIQILYKSQPIGYLRTIQQLQVLGQDGKSIDVFKDLTPDLFSRFFESAHPGEFSNDFVNFKTNLGKSARLQKKFVELLGDNQSVELNNEEVKNIVYPYVGLGSYTNNDSGVTTELSELKYTTLEGGHYIIDRTFSYKAGTFISSTNIITDLKGEARKRADERVKKALEISKTDGLNRYLLAVELPNGNIRFVSLVSPELSADQSQTLIADINNLAKVARTDNTKNDITFTQGSNKELIFDKVFNAHQPGIYSRFYIDSTGYLIGEFSDNNSFNQSSSTQPFLRYDLAANPLESIDAMIELFNDSIKNGSSLKDNKYKKVKFSKQTFKTSLPESISIREALAVFKSTVGPEIVKNISFGLNSVKSVADTNLGRSVMPTSMEEIVALAQSKKQTEVETKVEVEEDTTAEVFVKTDAEEDTTKDTKSSIFDQYKAMKDGEAAFLQKGRDKIVEDSKETDNPIGNAKASRLFEESEEAKAYYAELDRLEKLLDGEDDATFVALKIIEGSKYQEEDLNKLDEFRDWVSKNLPDIFTVEELKTLQENLVAGNVTVGSFVTYLDGVAGGIADVRGRINVGTRTPFKYHEAFHAVFRLLLSEKQIQRYLGTAKKEVLAQINSGKITWDNSAVKGVKTLDQALENLRLSNPLYSMMSKKQLEETLYEEYLADMFEAWKKNIKVPTDYTHKTIFAKIKDLIIAFFKRAFQRNNYQNLFKDIDLGKYANAVTQENRFTRSFEGGNPNIEALKTIKIDTERIKVKSGNTERYVKINKYLAGDRATRLIASVASSLHYLKQDPANSKVSDSDLYDRIFDDYIDFYNSDSDYYRDLDNFYDIKNDLDDIVKAFSGKENQDQLKEAAKDYLRVLSYQDSATEDDISNSVDDNGENSNTDARKESYTIGGFGSLSSYVRTYIATTSFQSNSEFGRPIEDGSLVYSVVDSAKVYNGLLSALSGITSEREGLRKLNFLRTNPNTDTAKFINKMFEDHNITFDPTGEPILNEIVNPGQLLAILKAFEKFKINYKFIGFDPSSGIVRIINANSRDDSKAQMVYWENQYQKKYDYNAELVKSQGPEVLSTLIDVIKGEDKETDVNELAILIEDTIGIDIQPLYINLSVVHNIPEELRTEDDLAIINGFPDVKPIDIEDLVQISKVISAGVNPFYRKPIVEENEDTTTEVEDTTVVDQTFEGAVQRLNTIAKGNVIFDETMGATSWINADGERVWGHQSPTYNHKKTRALRELADSTKLGEALEDVFAANNYMLSTDAFQSILPGLKLDRVDGIRLEALFNANGYTFSSNRIIDRGSDGTTAGQLSDIQYLVSNLALYLSGEKITYRNKSNNIISTGVTATINPGVIESSSTIDLVNLPVIKAVDTVNKQQVITNEVINAIRSMVKGEYERIRQVQKEINDPKIIKKDGYHTSYKGNEPRGLQFIRTASILGTELKKQLEDSAKEDIPFKDAIKDVNLEKQVNTFYNNYLDKFIDVMVEQNMIKIDKKTNLITYKTTEEGGIGGVPKFLVEGMMINKEEINEEMNSLKNLISVKEKDGPSYDTAFRHNLMQIFINHHINSTFFNYLINGDPARFIQAKSLSPAKIAIEEFKRLKGVNANGQSAYTELIAPNLGINQATTELDIATFVDPTYVGKFANDTVEEANAQMYITLKTLRHLLFGFGKLSKKQAAFLDKIEKGEELSPEEVFGKNGSISFDGQTNSLKIVYYNNGDNKAGYIKTSAFVLTKQLTTGSDNEALPGKEMLHNLRLSLEKQEVNGRLASAVPVSGSKGERKNIAASSQDISSDNFSVLDMRYLTLQQENPSNKMEITDPSQIKQLIGVELSASDKIIFQGKEWPARQLVELYEMAVAQRVSIKYNNKVTKIFGFEDVKAAVSESKGAKKITADLADFAKYAQNILKNTGATNQEIEFFALDENNNLKYDINNPIVEKKFIQLYFTYFTKGVMQEKVPGQSLTLVSSHGYNVVKVYTGQVDELGIPIGEVVRISDIKANPSKYKNLKTFSEETGLDGYKAGDLYIDKLRHNVPVYDKSGKVTERYSEVVMPAHDKNVYKYLKSGKIPDFIAKGFGIRIPSQDKHSGIGVRIVDFLPVFYGSVVIAPNELIEISGADFDVDKLYNSIKEFFYDKKNKQFVEYGSGKTDKQKFDQYVQYLSRTDEDYRVAYAALKEGEINEDKPITQDDLAKLKKKYEEGITEEEEIEENVNLVEKALKSLNYPSTPKEYAKLYKANGNRDIYIGALNNLILDAKYALTFNDYTSKPTDEFATGKVKGVKNAPRAFQVAHVEPLTDVLDDIKDDIKKLLLEILKKDGEETLSEELQGEFDALFNKAVSTFEEDGYDSTTLLGMYYGWKNNKEGAANIGASVKGNLSWGFLQKVGYQTLTPIFNINGRSYNNYASELTEDGVRKAYVISALITAMTDNAKERLAARLGLNITALNYVTHMIAVGVPLKTSIIFINQPSIKKYFDLVKAQEGEFKRQVKYVAPEDLMAKAVGLDNWEKFQIAFSELGFPRLNEQELLSQFYAETDLVQYAVINQLYSLSKTTPYFNDVASMTGLVKGFAPFMDTFDDVADKFDTLISKSDNNIFVDYDEDGNKINLFPSLLDKAPLTKSLLNIYFDIRGKLKYVFKRRTAPFMLLSKAVMNNVKLNMSGSFRRTFKNELDEDILSYLDIMAYKQYLTEKGNLDYLSSLNNSLIYKQEGIDSIVQKVQAVRKANSEKGLSNLFLDKFIFTINSEDTQNKDGLEYLESNSWSKLSPSMATRLESSFTELYNEDPKLAVELFHYLLVKDGGRYRSGSFLNVMPLFIMDDFFQATKKSMDILSNANSVDVLRSEGFRSTFGYNFDQLIDSFVFNYFRSANLSFKGQGISYIFNKFNPYLKDEDGKLSDKTNRTVKIDPKTGAITVNVFGGVRETRPKEKLEERRFVDIDGNNYAVYVASDSEETSSGPLNKEELERFIENTKFLSKFGFIQDKKYHTGGPPYLYFQGKLYKLSEVVGSTRKDKDIKSLLSFDTPSIKAYGSKFKYVPVTVRGSVKATRVGFAFDGQLPDAKEKEGDKKSKGENSSGNFSGSMEDIARLSQEAAAKKAKSEEQPKSTNNPLQQLSELGITKKPKEFIYVDETTGSTLTQYTGMVPQEVLDLVSRNTDEETENPFIEDVATYTGEIISLKENEIFVFGSNEGSSKGGQPTHGKGNAKVARDKFGAIQGQPRGLQGQSYGIVTKKFWDVLKSSSPEEIKREIERLYQFATNNPDKILKVAYMGGSEVVGNSGYTNAELASMFAAFSIPSNVQFEIEFAKGLNFTPSTEITTRVSSTPVAKKPAVSKEDSELQAIYNNRLPEDYRNRISFDDFKDNFSLLRNMGVPVEDIIKQLCK